MSDEALAALSLDEEVTCPICEAKLPLSALNQHIDMGCPPPPQSKKQDSTPAAEPASTPAMAPTAASTTPSTKGKAAKKKGRAIDISDITFGATSAQGQLSAKSAPGCGVPLKAQPSMGWLTLAHVSNVFTVGAPLKVTTVPLSPGGPAIVTTSGDDGVL